MLTARTPLPTPRTSASSVRETRCSLDVEFGEAAECCGEFAAREVADDGDGERLGRCAAVGALEAREVAAGAGGGGLAHPKKNFFGLGSPWYIELLEYCTQVQ